LRAKGLSKLKKLETSREQTVAAFEECKCRYRTLVETIPCGIEVTDVSGIIIFANQALHKMVGYEQGELIGRSALDFTAGDFERKETSGYLRTLLKEQPQLVPYFGQRLTRDGKALDVREDRNHKLDHQGKVIGWISALTNVSEECKDCKRDLKQKSQKTLLIIIMMV